ncbi:hypothetical protein EQG63_01205 [Flavobacterium amnicola]|uniref:DUF2460 domain-containing protein n=1 Tax=Flavobacterium amnicola TaxID=2506422 RepID=A0A4Q1K7N6_9FLAO|nr:hypothetical protein [Flavobacterium amnicola]RXR20579.1 hypothetical protein EQG63_01205 [Flavobacterium amnicola]
MIQRLFFLLVMFGLSGMYAQEITSPYHIKKIVVDRDSISIDSVSINTSFFKVLNANQEPIDTSLYKIDYTKSILVFKNGFRSQDTVTVRYLKFPDFLTKEYTIYDKSRVVENKPYGSLYKTSQETFTKYKPFDGLNTSGSITRGITVGNNQNTSVNSNLDLQITGKLSDKVSLRASLQDSNIPLQEGGYSQKLDEFDQIFIELFSDKWSIRAGDLFLENRKSRFLNFNKKVQGLATQFTFGTPENKTEVFASGALVRGQYAKSTFTGQEGNQGPYKLKGPNGELYILVISGSERVYVNGVLLTRGENNQYVIDYNAGEVTFTSLYPITSEMRISIEYQYSERNYTRFVTYAGANHENEKWSLGGAIYSENDVKNQPVQQNLSPEQAQILANAGDDVKLMNAQSAVLDTYSENKILYKKTTIGPDEVFEYSTVETDVLYNVKFSFVGNNQGNYKLKTSITNGRIFEYIAPIAGIPQGNYEPIIKLVAPTKLQVASLMGKYKPSEKTAVDFELGVSNNDKNLFSGINDKDNQGLAGKLNFNQRLFSKKWNVNAFGNFQLIQKNFKGIERLFTIEFDRDWNLNAPIGNQSLIISGLQFELPSKSNWKYQYENLKFSESFSGNRNIVLGYYKYNNWLFSNDGSYLNTDSNLATSKFLRNTAQTRYHFKKNWVGGSFRLENNQETTKATNQLSILSQKFTEYGAFVGRGDSTKVFVELGYLHRVNDSLQLGKLERVNTSQSYYVKSKLIQNETRDLSVFVNYRNLKFTDIRGNEPSLNSRVLYNDNFFSQKIQWTTMYENNSGTIAQQEFSFLEVEPGKGIFAWNDYNNNGIQELQEFEIAPFPDQAKYVKIFLPNQIFIKTHQNKFSQSVTLNPSSWMNSTGFRKFLSYFYNQSSYLIERKIKRDGDNFDLNPFASKEQNLLGLSSSIRNSLFFNRGKQQHSVTYTFVSNNLKNLQVSDELQSKNNSHQLQYVHLLQKSWLFTLTENWLASENSSLNYASRNFEISGNKLESKVGYLFSKNASWDVFYILQNKDNKLGDLESLKHNQLGTTFNFASEKKITINGEFSLINNQFSGNPFSPVGFQMLEGLQAGKNTTWRLLVQKNLTQYLDININYQGRKSETADTVHTGNIQLRAYF